MTATPLLNKPVEICNLRNVCQVASERTSAKDFRKNIANKLASFDRTIAKEGQAQLKSYADSFMVVQSKNILSLPNLEEYTVWLKPTELQAEIIRIFEKNLIIDKAKYYFQMVHL